MKKIILIILGTLVFSGCATYKTPGGSVHLSNLSEVDINEMLSKKSAADFPANIAIARVQASNYSSYSLDSYGEGRYSVVTTREIETEADFSTLNGMLKVEGIAPINKILLPERLDSIKALRVAAARLKADILLLYTIDTKFQASGENFSALDLISLGFLSNKNVVVTTTASAAFFDVRTEYLYGLAEWTAKKSKNSNSWSTSQAVDTLRIDTEKDAFQGLIHEIQKTWTGIAKEYSH